MSESSQLVFYGEILPGHDADTVKAKLGDLLKLPSEQIAAVFSGRRVVLRKSLPSDQAASYVTRLEKIGVKVFAETLPQVAEVPAAPVVEQVATPPAAPQVAPVPQAAAAAVPQTSMLALAEAPPVEEMDCPKCGERQPKRTLCRACSVDMKRFSESQQQAEQEAREERMVEREIAMASSGRGGRARVADDDAVGIFGLGFSGRLGRRSFLAGNLLCWALIAFAVVVMVKLNSVFIAGLVVLIATIASLRLSVLRCHDANWTGWLSLIFFIPYIGPLFGLVLMFMPGSKEDNNHGSSSPAPSFPMGFAVVALFALSVGLLYKQQDAFFAYATGQSMGSSLQQAGKGSGGRVLSVAEADVEMFTTSDCGVCHLAKAYMNKHGITYAEKDVEQNEDYLRDFYARGGRGVPYIFVGDQSMMGFDPEWLERVLANR